MAILFYSQSFCQKSAERKSPKKYFSYFVLMSGGTYSLKSTPNYRFFEAIFYLLSQLVFARNLLRGSSRRNICSYFILLDGMSDLGFEPWPDVL